MLWEHLAPRIKGTKNKLPTLILGVVFLDFNQCRL